MFKSAVNDLNECVEIRRSVEEGKLKPEEVVEELSKLSVDELVKLGNNFRRFPIGCDLVEVGVGCCASDLSVEQLLEYSILCDVLGVSIHVCAYAYADVAERYGMDGIELLKMAREVTDVPMDVDHLGEYGAMRFPKEITSCSGLCYTKGEFRKECPKGRIHRRLIDKEREAGNPEEWIKLVGLVSCNVIALQGGEAHCASFREMKRVAELAKELGKGVGVIMYAGDGYEDVIEGLNGCLKLDADVIFVEGGPFAKDIKAYLTAVVSARILSKGKVVGTNGAYEDQLRFGLRAGLNCVITGFPKNHHGYMAGFKPEEAKRGAFGLPRVIRIIREEVRSKYLNVPAGRRELEGIAKAVKIVGVENVYPNKFSWTSIGDAHWFVVSKAPIFEKVSVNGVDIECETLALLGGRYVAWYLAEKADSVIVSDRDGWVEDITTRILEEKGIEVLRANGNDEFAVKNADVAVITSVFPEICLKLLKKFPNAVVLI